MFKRLRRLLAQFLPTMTVLGFVAVVLCFVNRWDQVTPMTLIPIWIWACAGCLGCTLAWLVSRSGVCLAVFLCWIAVAVVFSDGSLSLYHEMREAFGGKSARPERALRVVVFEAEGAGHDAVWEIARLSPDIVLLQGAPETELARLAADFFEGEGSYVAAEQCAVLAKGKLRSAPLPPDLQGARALVEWPGGVFFDVVSLRLQSSHPRWDFFRPDVWGQQVAARLSNRSTLRDMMRTLEEVVVDEDSKLLRVIGGNFGTPAGDDIFRHLHSQGLEDAHRTAGQGWGSTYPATYPLLRVDQVWIAPGLVPLSVSTVRIGDARHRLLLADFSFGAVEPPAAEPVAAP